MSSPLLAVETVSKRFAGLLAVSDVSFSIAAGELLSIIGPNGAGKTTLFNLITGQHRPTTGNIRFEGKVVTTLAPYARARTGLGRTFQIARPFGAMTALENVMIGTFLDTRSRHAAEDRAIEILADVDLLDRAGRRAADLSLSERRRLEVARALALRPRLILLDEVMAGLNATEIDLAIQLVQRLHARGMSFLVIEHNLRVVRAISDRVMVLDHGVMIAQGQADEVLTNVDVVAAYLGRRG